ncbi:MAG TPA: glycoside hydrolase family 3 N-terminal domain-containing protein [Kofleriaceae bacterium]|nr:glycoside hydrolase family 3 N-terminal domain-containing protein [Kofleriaceae bacterium]
MTSHVERARALVARMTLAEKVSQLVNASPAIDRLGVPAHDWWNECLHGVARAGIATVFPQAIGLAASFDPALVGRIATAISDEARAKHHEAARRGVRGQYSGLTFWSPNLNLYRDPRWGRGQETYGEDPDLTARLGVAFVRGLQGDDPTWLKLVATPKHFAVHSGPEALRHSFDAHATRPDLASSYLPQFEAAVREGGAASIMTAYNRLNGEPCSSNRWLIEDVLRRTWGFDGVVVSDCGAIDDIAGGHRVVATRMEAAARALRAGCDLECGGCYKQLGDALAAGLVGEADIDGAAVRVLTTRVRLGTFEPPGRVPYADIPPSVVACAEHVALAREAARRSMVLLANNGVLPLRRDRRVRVAVIGPGADSMDVLCGNYHGTPSRELTLLGALREEPNLEVAHVRGCDLTGPDRSDVAAAAAAARSAEVAILVLGLSPRIEGEEGDAELAPGAGSGDRDSLELPGVQAELLAAVAATGTPVVLILTGGGCLSFDAGLVRAAVMAWYPGQEGGPALADLLLGRAAFTGRLPITFYHSVADLPPFEDYSMERRTHRFFRGRTLFAFGHGLTYTGATGAH